MTTRERIQSGNYDYSSPKIECVADALHYGRIFEFRRDGQTVIILALDSIEAEEIFQRVKRSKNCA
jgi:hypothetical protein